MTRKQLKLKAEIEYLIKEFNHETVGEDTPYISECKLNIINKQNHQYNQDAECVCGHPYHRHFDPWEKDDYEFHSCKYCGCNEFVEKVVD